MTKRKQFNVLSLFDGISCGQIALNRAKIKYNKYYASEIDKAAITVTQTNYPNTIQLGDVTKIRSKKLPKIDLLIGGSPCQGFSFAGKRLAFDDPRSKLFFQFVRLLKSIRKTNPKVKFLLENVRMKKEHLNVITKLLGVKPICINSALVSAQNRVRYYWTNIEGIEQPKDKGILLKDILEDGLNNVKVGRIVGRKINPDTGKRDDYNPQLKTVQRIEPRLDNKCGTLTTVEKDNVVIVHRINSSQDGIVISEVGKTPCLTAGNNNYPKLSKGNYDWRKLTPIECERLQTVSDNYTNQINDTQRYKMLGNGFTVDVVAHILRAMKRSKILKCNLHYYEPSINTSIQ